MGRKTYVDTNIFDHIVKRIGITEADERALRSAVNKGRISVLLSYLNLEEALCAMPTSPELALAQLRLIMEIAETHQLVKPTAMLISDDIDRYAKGKALLPPFIPMDTIIFANLQALVRDAQQINELLPLLKEVQNEKEEFVARMREANAKVEPDATALRRATDGRPPSWDKYWDRLAEPFGEGFVTPRNLEQCKKRGIKGLLKMRSIRTAVGSAVSLAYAETFDKRTPKLGDSRDMQHAVLASAADLFVTHDAALARLLSRIPQVPFEVVDFHNLLREIA
jgi:hypothetical protein